MFQKEPGQADPSNWYFFGIGAIVVVGLYLAWRFGAFTLTGEGSVAETIRRRAAESRDTEVAEALSRGTPIAAAGVDTERAGAGGGLTIPVASASAGEPALARPRNMVKGGGLIRAGISLDAREAPLREVLRAISRQTVEGGDPSSGLRFTYSKRTGAMPVSIRIADATPQEVFRALQDEYPLNFKPVRGRRGRGWLVHRTLTRDQKAAVEEKVRRKGEALDQTIREAIEEDRKKYEKYRKSGGAAGDAEVPGVEKP